MYGKTKREAQERLRTVMAAADGGLKPFERRITVGAYLAEWLAGPVATRTRARTAQSYADTVRRYIDPALGRLPLAKLEPRDVTAMLSRLTARGNLSPTTVATPTSSCGWRSAGP